MVKHLWWPRAIVALIAVAGAAQMARSASYDPKIRWDRIRTPHFTLIYPQAIQSVAQSTARFAEEAYATLSPKFHWKPLGRVSIVLTDNIDSANGLATVLPYNILFLRASAPDPHGSLASYDEWMRLLVTHELTHIMHMDQARGIMRVPRAVLGKVVSPNGMMPGWMREGLAVHEETVNTGAGRNRGMYGQMLMRTAADQHRWPRIDQADGLGWKWPGFLPQYLYGGKFIEWLAERFGPEKVVEFQTRSARTPLWYMHNHIAKNVWGKSFYKLWKEWRDDASQRLQAQTAAVRAAGESPTTVVLQDGEQMSALSRSRDGQLVSYTSTSPYRAAEIWWKRIGATGEQAGGRIVRKMNATATAIDGTGTKVAFSALGTRKKYRFSFASDLYLYDIATKKLGQLTFNRRASDPAFSPDNRELLYVHEVNGAQALVRHTLATHAEQTIPIRVPAGSRFSGPQWSPDGKSIAVSSHQGATHDLYIYNLDGTLHTRVTRDTAVETSPAWDAKGRYLYFASDRSGISNIYRLQRASGRIEQVTNVVTGVFDPKPAPDGKSLYVQYYTGDGFDVRSVDVAAVRKPWWTGKIAARGAAGATPIAAVPGDAPVFPVADYTPWGPQLFVPRFIQPFIQLGGDGAFVTAYTGGQDPLLRHKWLAGISYRSDAGYVGYAASYTYNRLTPAFSLGVINYPTDSGVRFSDGSHIFEKRIRGYVSAGFPFGELSHNQSLGIGYFMENRDLIPDVTPADRATYFNLDRYAGVNISYGRGALEQYAASISPERKYRLTMNLAVTHKALGSAADNEQQVFSGEWRQFFPLGKRHVIAARLKGGIALGDDFRQGTFSFGGALGEGAFSGGGGSGYYFPFRGIALGTYSSTRAVLASAEYRFPIYSPQRGLGTMPFYIQNIHGALFTDFGNAWNKTSDTGSWPLDKFLLSAGGEVRGDFIIGHGLPLVARAGYGIVLRNRDRIASGDRSGVAIVQVGSSF